MCHSEYRSIKVTLIITYNTPPRDIRCPEPKQDLSPNKDDSSSFWYLFYKLGDYTPICKTPQNHDDLTAGKIIVGGARARAFPLAGYPRSTQWII